jgi:hypothetical protein
MESLKAYPIRGGLRAGPDSLVRAPPLNAHAKGGKPSLMSLISTSLNLPLSSLEPIQMEPGRTIRLLCPFCQGGSKAEESLSISIESKSTAYFKCFRGSCSNTGRISTESSRSSRPNPIGQFKVKELLQKEEAFQSIDEEIALFFSSRLGIDKTTLESCGVRRFFGSFPTTYEMEEAEARPRSYAALISSIGGARQAVVGIDIKEAEGSVDAMVRGAGQLGAGSDPHLAKVLSLPKSSIKVLPSNKQVLWGHDDALSVPPVDRLVVEETHMLIIVETPLERMAMVQAGFDQGSIVSLPFGVVEAFQQEGKRKVDLLKQDFKLKKQRSTKKEAQALEGRLTCTLNLMSSACLHPLGPYALDPHDEHVEEEPCEGVRLLLHARVRCRSMQECDVAWRDEKILIDSQRAASRDAVERAAGSIPGHLTGVAKCQRGLVRKETSPGLHHVIFGLHGSTLGDEASC